MKAAIITTIIAYIVGLVADANIDADGFFMLRVFLPMLTMGIFILKNKDKKEK